VEALRESRRGCVEVYGLWASARAHVAVGVARRLGCNLLIVAAGRSECEDIHDDVCTFADPSRAVFFPSWQVLPGDEVGPSDEIMAERLAVLERLAFAPAETKPFHIIAAVRSVVQLVVPKDLLAGQPNGSREAGRRPVHIGSQPQTVPVGL